MTDIYPIGSKVLIVSGFYKNRTGTVVKIPSSLDIENMVERFNESGYDSDDQEVIPDSYHVIVDGVIDSDHAHLRVTDFPHRVTFLQQEDLERFSTST